MINEDINESINNSDDNYISNTQNPSFICAKLKALHAKTAIVQIIRYAVSQSINQLVFYQVSV